MPGDEWQRFANLRLLYTYMYTHPGKKLLFMGSEFGQGEEWDSTKVLDWWVLDYPVHQGVQRLIRTLNGLYQSEPPLHSLDFDWQGFEWIDCHDAHNSVLIYQRRATPPTADQDPEAEEQPSTGHLVVALNFTPVPREGYRIGMPSAGAYREVFNSDVTDFGGSGMGNGSDPLQTEPVGWMNRPNSLVLTLPPLAGIVLKPVATPGVPPQTASEVPGD
jgi:1,4-alpha-glucan branching enzyme